MQRDWTDAKRDEWIGRRLARRKRVAKPGSDPEHPRERSLEAERVEVESNVFSVITETLAWELQKYPTSPYPAPFSGKLFLPLRYQGDDYARTLKYKQGEDLNVLVYRFYDAPPDPGFAGPNYVTPDNTYPKRNEYLGPAPHVTGYRFDAAARTARIEWWDPYVRTLWVGRGTWGVELYFDEVVRGWVSRPRGDFDAGVDLERYMGP
ncbi:uncharacterized protein TRAVEDRAFT_125185 [Trametes versicolor FP-101664 SS1]|uniref:uncharacterized protein n=1 Tax=Trametes versicolor (strain FP-101664) TaxID=717944 RepID=UPI0004621BC9|nr:uncharacterized protein TRAVEDRAFT_125185 [Trametes versicolor FP-101664 SS1]EIW57275.1 hypothetical protein TRAVEDRAFT_125185 [Trametes versicolor FP-101664 SS1]